MGRAGASAADTASADRSDLRRSPRYEVDLDAAVLHLPWEPHERLDPTHDGRGVVVTTKRATVRKIHVPVCRAIGILALLFAGWSKAGVRLKLETCQRRLSFDLWPVLRGQFSPRWRHGGRFTHSERKIAPEATP
jgi:hypothetical protein